MSFSNPASNQRKKKNFLRFGSTGLRIRAQSAGLSVSALIIERKTATEIVTPNWRYISPVIPGRKQTGTNMASNTEVVTVSGRTLTAVGVGKTTITVQAGDATDSVEVLVMKSMPTGIEISNESELTNAWVVGDADRTVHVTFTPGDFTEDTATFAVESSDPEVIRVDGKKLVAVGAGTAIITVKVGDATDTVEITISLADPTITAEDQIDVVYDKTYDVFDLVTAESCDGLDLSDDIVVTFEDDGITYDAEKGTLSFDNTKSAYTVTFTVSDPRDGSFTATKTVTFNVYRNPLGTSNYEFTFSNIAGGDAAQTATVNTDNLAYAYYSATAVRLIRACRSASATLSPTIRRA